MRRTTFNVDINNLQVDSRYFTFDYKIYMGEVLFMQGNYENSHEWDNIQEFKMLLDDGGEAALLVLSRL